MKILLTIVFICVSFSSTAAIGDFSSVSNQPGNYLIKFGLGVETMECRHVVIKDNGSRVTTIYGFATDDYGYCPGFESTEYKMAFNALFGSSKLPQFVIKIHDLNDINCFDDPELWGWGF